MKFGLVIRLTARGLFGLCALGGTDSRWVDFSWLKCETKRTDRRTPEVWQQKPLKSCWAPKGKGCIPTIVFPRGYVSFRQDPVFFKSAILPIILAGLKRLSVVQEFFFESGSVSSDRKVGVLRCDEESHRPRSTKDLPSISGEDSHFSNIFHLNLQWNTIKFDGVLITLNKRFREMILDFEFIYHKSPYL